MAEYHSNLASEFDVLSLLHRLDTDGALTPGNKKAVDIIVANEDVTTTTIDAKRLEERYDGCLDRLRERYSI